MHALILYIIIRWRTFCFSEGTCSLTLSLPLPFPHSPLVCPENSSPVNGSCQCDSGFQGDPANCINIDDCDPNPCQNGGTCNDLIGGFSCICVPGVNGDNCINDCDPNPCQNGGTCNNLIGGFSCTCVPGFTGDSCTTDINDCDPNPCQNGGTCTDGMNTFSCNCAPIYSGDSCTSKWCLVISA